jgi:hypothetical protein
MTPSVKKLWRLYLVEEKSLKDISNMTGFTQEYIREQFLANYQEEFKTLAKARKFGSRKAKPKTYINVPQIDPAEVWRLYAAEGYTIIKIALHFSVSEYKIRKMLLKNPNYR